MQMWREKTYPPIPGNSPRSHPQEARPPPPDIVLAGADPLTGWKEKGGREGSFLTLEMSGMCGDYRMAGGGGTCKTALPISPAPSLQGCRFWGAPACIDQGLKWSPVEQP